MIDPPGFWEVAVRALVYGHMDNVMVFAVVSVVIIPMGDGFAYE